MARTAATITTRIFKLSYRRVRADVAADRSAGSSYDRDAVFATACSAAVEVSAGAGLHDAFGTVTVRDLRFPSCAGDRSSKPVPQPVLRRVALEPIYARLYSDSAVIAGLARAHERAARQSSRLELRAVARAANSCDDLAELDDFDLFHPRHRHSARWYAT